jgi:hypothetical protein
MAAERAREAAALRRADGVLAISDRDLEVFRRDYGVDGAVNLPVGYLGGGAAARPRAAVTPLRFGFIGSGMEANRLALEALLRHWWPAIHRFSPMSRLLIAGRIAEDPAVEDRAFLRDEIALLGPVDFASRFYGEIDVLLSPVAIPGGLNIKAVEALLHRRIVITDGLGARPLRPLELATRVGSGGGEGAEGAGDRAGEGAELVALLGRIEDRDPELMRRIAANFREAARLFGRQEGELDRIRGIFSGGPRDAGPRDAGPRDPGARDAGLRDSGPRDPGPPRFGPP